MPLEASLAGDGQFRYFRNGRKMQDSLPLWQGTKEQGAETRDAEERAGRGRPQVPTR